MFHPLYDCLGVEIDWGDFSLESEGVGAEEVVVEDEGHLEVENASDTILHSIKWRRECIQALEEVLYFLPPPYVHHAHSEA